MSDKKHIKIPKITLNSRASSRLKRFVKKSVADSEKNDIVSKNTIGKITEVNIDESYHVEIFKEKYDKVVTGITDVIENHSHYIIVGLNNKNEIEKIIAIDVGYSHDFHHHEIKNVIIDNNFIVGVTEEGDVTSLTNHAHIHHFRIKID